jgi:hypothetical protein
MILPDDTSVPIRGDLTMSTDFLPDADARALEFMKAFAAGVAGDVAAYHLDPADAAAISAAVDAFDAAFLVAASPATRTRVTVREKSAARDAAEAVVRRYAALIRVDDAIPDADKIAVGVRPVNTSRTPVPAPATSPLLNVVGITPGVQHLRFADSATPLRGAKPFGAASLQLFVAVGDAPATDPAAALFRAAFTRNPVAVPFDASAGGKVATHFARWASARGEVGPWSLPVSMRVAA